MKTNGNYDLVEIVVFIWFCLLLCLLALCVINIFIDTF